MTLGGQSPCPTSFEVEGREEEEMAGGQRTHNREEAHTHTHRRMRKEERKPESPWWAPTSKKFSKRQSGGRTGQQ